MPLMPGSLFILLSPRSVAIWPDEIPSEQRNQRVGFFGSRSVPTRRSTSTREVSAPVWMSGVPSRGGPPPRRRRAATGPRRSCRYSCATQIGFSVRLILGEMHASGDEQRAHPRSAANRVQQGIVSRGRAFGGDPYRRDQGATPLAVAVAQDAAAHPSLKSIGHAPLPLGASALGKNDPPLLVRTDPPIILGARQAPARHFPLHP